MSVPLYTTDASARNFNDVYYQLENINKLLNHDYMFETGKYVDYQFNPARLDNDSKRLLKLIVSSDNPVPLSADNFANIDNSSKYGFKGTPIPTQNVDSNNNLLLNINNSSNIRKYYIDQYASDFKGIINDLIYNNPYISIVAKEINPEDPVAYLNSFENYLLKLVHKLSALKGTFYIIDLVLRLYEKFFRELVVVNSNSFIQKYELISLKEDPNYPFIYRITSTLPVEIWRNNIKSLVHPLSWLDNYNIIENHISDVYVQSFDKFRKISSTYKINTISYIDAERYFLNRSVYNTSLYSNQSSAYNYIGDETKYSLPSSSVTAYFPPTLNADVSGNYFINMRYIKNLNNNSYIEGKYISNLNEKRILDAYGRLTVPFDDIWKLGYKKFNLCTGSSNFINNDSTNNDYLQLGNNLNNNYFFTIDNISFDLQIDLKNNICNISFLYPKPGLFLQYIWEIYNKNSLIQTDISYFNKYNLDLANLCSRQNYASYNFLNNFRIELTVVYNKYKKKIFQYNLGALISRKDLIISSEEKFWNRNYLSTRMKNILVNSLPITGNYISSSPTMNYQDISLQSFNEEDRFTTISYMSYTTSSGNTTNMIEYDPILSQSVTSDVTSGDRLIQTNNNNDFYLEFHPKLISDDTKLLYAIISKYRWVLKYTSDINQTYPEYITLYNIITYSHKINFKIDKNVDASYALELFVTINNGVEYKVNTSNFIFTDQKSINND